MTIDELLVEYQTATGGMTEPVRPFLHGLEDVGATLEASLINKVSEPASWVVVMVTTLGLASVRVRYVSVPNRPLGWWVDGTIHDWGSVHGLDLVYQGRYGEDPSWMLTLAHPEMKLSDGDPAKIRGFAAAILQHVSRLAAPVVSRW